VAQAGHCSECNDNEYLTEGGGCVNGHGPECITGVYDVPDPGAGVPEVAPAAPGYAPAPVTAAATPKKKRTGLVIAIVVILVLLLCVGAGVGGFLLFLPAGSKTTTGTGTSTPGSKPASKPADAKARIEAGFAFLKGMGTGDIELFKTVMPDATVKQVPKETWDSLMTDAAADPTVFGELTFSGETGTATFSSSDGSKGTMDFKVVGTGTVVATLKPEASESEDATLTVVSENGRWTVTQFETIDGVLKFDPASVKALGQ